MGGSRMAGSKMDGSRMGGTMGGSRMGGGSRMAIGGSRMDGTRMEGSMIQEQSMLPFMQPHIQTGNGPIPGNPKKAIMNQDEMTVEGVRFVETKSLKIEGNITYITHSRRIGEAVYEIEATVENGVFTMFDVHTNLEDEREIYDMESMWIEVWPSMDDVAMPEGSMMPLASNGMGGSRMGGSRMGGSRMGGSRMGGSRLGGSRMGGSRMGGSRMGGSRMGGSRMGGSRMEGSRIAGSKIAGSKVGSTGGSRMAASSGLPAKLPGQ